MRKLIVLLLGSFMVCVATFTGVHATSTAPDRKVYATECVMHAPTMVVTCDIDTVATAPAVALMQVMGPVAPDSLIAVDGGIEYLVLVRSMTCPPERLRGLATRGQESPSTGAGPPNKNSQRQLRRQ